MTINVLRNEIMSGAQVSGPNVLSVWIGITIGLVLVWWGKIKSNCCIHCTHTDTFRWLITRLHTHWHISLAYYKIAHTLTHFVGLLQDCSNSIANALELLQSCNKPSIYASLGQWWVEHTNNARNQTFWKCHLVIKIIFEFIDLERNVIKTCLSLQIALCTLLVKYEWQVVRIDLMIV